MEYCYYLWILLITLLQTKKLACSQQQTSNSLFTQKIGYFNKFYDSTKLSSTSNQEIHAATVFECAIICQSYNHLEKLLSKRCWSFQFDSTNGLCSVVYAWIAGNKQEIVVHNIVLASRQGVRLYSAIECYSRSHDMCNKVNVTSKSVTFGRGIYTLQKEYLWQRPVYSRESGDFYIHYLHDANAWGLSETLDAYLTKTQKSVVSLSEETRSCLPFVAWTKGENISVTCLN